MQFMSLSLAGGLLLLAVGVAAGGPATVTADLDLNTGRGSEYRDVDVMPPETAVKVLDCDLSWCRVARDDAMAYASRSDLDLGNAVSAEALPSSFVPLPLPLLFAWHRGWSGRYWHHKWYQQH